MLVPAIEELVKYRKSYIERQLPGGEKGKILVNIGDEVKGFNVVAEVERDEVQKKKVGVQSWQKGKQVFKLTAGSAGRIHDLIEGTAVLIESVASFVRCLLGFGAESEGEIKVVASYDKVVTPEVIDVSHRGKILVGGSFVEASTLAKAEAIGAKGFVCGGVDFFSVAEIAFPLLVTEGYGKIPMNKEVFDFLSGVELRYVILSPDRRELIVPPLDPLNKEELEEQGVKEVPAFVELKKEDQVQIFVDRYFGLTGEVKKILERFKFESEVEEAACEVGLAGGEKVIVPLRNVGKLIQ